MQRCSVSVSLAHPSVECYSLKSLKIFLVLFLRLFSLCFIVYVCLSVSRLTLSFFLLLWLLRIKIIFIRKEEEEEEEEEEEK